MFFLTLVGEGKTSMVSEFVRTGWLAHSSQQCGHVRHISMKSKRVFSVLHDSHCMLVNTLGTKLRHARRERFFLNNGCYCALTPHHGYDSFLGRLTLRGELTKVTVTR